MLVFIFVVAISVLFTYLGIVVPLRKLSKIMEDATTYEFSALKDQKTVDSRSIILELEAMQASFFQMIKNFADAIQSNKELLNSKGSGTKLSRGDASESSFNV